MERVTVSRGVTLVQRMGDSRVHGSSAKGTGASKEFLSPTVLVACHLL